MIRLSPVFEVMEYFELVSEDEISYKYVVSDPQMYTANWTVEMSISRRPAGDRLYEYACHEANYSLAAILRGARVAEKEAQNPLTTGGDP
jgi:hypothetical protein